MKVDSISISHLRNHINTHLDFSDDFNIIFGDNGAGKTTILESLSICSISKSFLPTPETQLIKFGESEFNLSLKATSDLNIPYSINVNYNNVFKKKINGTLGDNLKPKDIIGHLNAVIVSPDFKNITFGGPIFRRSFLDKAISQVSKTYYEELIRNKKSLKQRNSILQKAKKDKSLNNQLLDSWTNIFIESSAKIISKRSDFIRDFIEYFNLNYKDVSKNIEHVSIKYNPYGFNDSENSFDLISIKNKLFEIALSRKKIEIDRGQTTFGPQKDDLDFLINNGLAKNIASQGQHKSILVSLIISEYDYLKNLNNEKPIVLLDDLFSELDDKRCENVFELLKERKTQAFITITNPSKVKNFNQMNSSFTYIQISNGKKI